MRHISLKYDKTVVLTVFLVSYAIYAAALSVEFQKIFTDDFFKDTYNEVKNEEYVQMLISLNNESIPINFAVAIFIVLIPAYAVAACLWLGFSLIEKGVAFGKCLKISAWANLIFPVNYLVSVLLRVTHILPYNELNVNNNFRYQSILSVMRYDVSDWLIYPLEKINATELIFVLLLGYFISRIFAYSITPVRDKGLLRKVPIAYSFQCARAVPRAYSRRNNMLLMPHRDS